LDLTWTLAYRYWAPIELLTRDADVRNWLVAAGAVAPDAPVTDGVLPITRDLREAIYRSAHKRIDGKILAAADIDLINRWASSPRAAPQLTRQSGVTWDADDAVSAGLAAVAVDAVEVLSSPPERLRECMRDSCSALFYDASRAGRRRWCLLEVCGNAINTARHRRKVGGRSDDNGLSRATKRTPLD
jgi:predicted RNA-binding Zn ribbon-like protein